MPQAREINYVHVYKATVKHTKGQPPGKIMRHVYTMHIYNSLKFWKYRGVIAKSELQQWIDTLGDGGLTKDFDEYKGDRIDENDQPLNSATIQLIIASTRFGKYAVPAHNTDPL